MGGKLRAELKKQMGMIGGYNEGYAAKEKENNQPRGKPRGIEPSL